MGKSYRLEFSQIRNTNGQCGKTLTSLGSKHRNINMFIFKASLGESKYFYQVLALLNVRLYF